MAGQALLVSLTILLCAAGCGKGDQPLDAVDFHAAPEHPSYEQVRNIIDRSCVPCHKGEESNDEKKRGGTAAEPGLESCIAVLLQAGPIVRTAIDEESMPPGAWPRLSEREKLIILRWIADGSCGPCRECP